ncbi:CLUMA_CG019974, isoform A [Clunio marinus]|uniref:non-specific serine/threonine protein kinase n=1 Tax=Clunio marinus TaxID=568069 RepID=A0A1J1J7U8_9DIPT|nr:CLUMA_CG019974, isoform A [Clunio marinus]
MTTPQIIKQGAEAKLYIGKYNEKRCLVKERFVKTYRLTEIDKTLTKARIKAEQKTTKRCENAGILVPKVYNVDFNERKVYMEYFDKAMTVKEFIVQVQKEKKLEELDMLMKRIGEVIGKFHANNIIHGDLTTSNMLINPKENDYDLIMIDFGLSSFSTSHEDKGVDLYVLERALLSTHSDLPDLFNSILKHYKDINPSTETIRKFEEVRARGRKRTMIG